MNERRPSAKELDALFQSLLFMGHLIDQGADEALQPHGLSLAKLGVLQNLVQAGEPLPLGVLSERLGCVKSNVTQLVDRLEAEDLVRRVPDPQDRRSKLATITEEGRRRYEEGRRALEGAEREMLGSLSGSDREQLARLLGHFEGRSP